jgi:NAD(P)-dependent dehydrogenase (short-subunit alcohol dehydrogenase family)
MIHPAPARASLCSREALAMGKLDDKVVLVTGASRGIGKAIAELFAAEGARVACTARTIEEGSHQLSGSLRTTVDGILARGGEATAVPADVSEFENCEKAVERVRDTYGPIDVLINNAALTYFLPISTFSTGKWLRSVAVNFHAPFYLSQLVLADMLPRKSGAIVNISSGAAIGPGRGPYPEPALRGGTLYGAEKAALERFTQGLAQEVYPENVAVTCVSPSQIVPTPGVMYHQLLQDENDPRAENVEMMARAALLLATEPVDKVTGRVTYSQEILAEFGWIEKGQGTGIDRVGSGYSQI